MGNNNNNNSNIFQKNTASFGPTNVITNSMTGNSMANTGAFGPSMNALPGNNNFNIGANNN